MAAPLPNRETLIETAKVMWIQGFTFPNISTKIGVKPDTLKGWCIRQKWQKVKSIIQADVQQACVTVVKDGLENASKEAKTALSTAVLEQTRLLNQNPVKRIAELGNTPARQGRSAVLKTLVESADKLYGWSAEAGGTTINQALFFELPGEPEKSETVIDVTPQDAGNSEPQT